MLFVSRDGNAILVVRNISDGVVSRLNRRDTVKENTGELEDTVRESIQSKPERKKRMKKWTEPSGLQDSTRWTNTGIIGAPKGAKKEGEIQKLFEGIRGKNFQKCDKNCIIQRDQQTPGRKLHKGNHGQITENFG